MHQITFKNLQIYHFQKRQISRRVSAVLKPRSEFSTCALCSCNQQINMMFALCVHLTYFRKVLKVTSRQLYGTFWITPQTHYISAKLYRGLNCRWKKPTPDYWHCPDIHRVIGLSRRYRRTNADSKEKLKPTELLTEFRTEIQALAELLA